MGTYVPNTLKEQQEMLQILGVSSFRELFRAVPEGVYLEDELKLERGLSEFEVRRRMSQTAARNQVFGSIFRGAGAYHHYIPSIVSQITSKEEFMTAYTPYQAEISQGILQSIFEYQTIICGSGSGDYVQGAKPPESIDLGNRSSPDHRSNKDLLLRNGY